MHLKKCIEFLEDYNSNKKNLVGKLKHIGKLFCLGYIKTYCYIFIKMFDKSESNYKEIFKVVNKKGNIIKMIRLYIYKIICKKNKDIYAFFNEKIIKDYCLEEYLEFNKFIINFGEENQNNFTLTTLKNENYKITYQIIEKYKEEEFKNSINKNDFDIEKMGIDNFYIASNNLVLSYLKCDNFKKSDIYTNFCTNFYNNFCKNLFNENEKLLTAIQLFFDPKKYNLIKEKYKIKSSDMKILLFGYRYCLNEIFNQNKNGIYYPLYEIEKSQYLKTKYFPGNNTKEHPYYELYSKVKNHFKEKPNEGCYVCLCKVGFYHSLPLSFQRSDWIKNMTCPKCSERIGVTRSTFFREWKLEKRENYYRIFENKDQIEKEKNDKNNENKIKINYKMTFKEFKKRYIDKLFKNEIGVSIISKNHFIKNYKIIRNLSQISYRLLNFILYSHLFFAKLITDNGKLDIYLPKGMTWMETLTECWYQLKNELLKKGPYPIEIFMDYIFKELFLSLNKKEIIDDYDTFIDFENSLEKLIQEKMKELPAIIKDHEKPINKNNKNKDKFYSINLLKETFDSSNYSKDQYPFYENFYYTDYLDETYIIENLKHMDEKKYPILKKYLDYTKNEKQNKKDDSSLDNLNLFNSVLNLFNEEYSYQITRGDAEKKCLKDEEIYMNNTELIEKFIKFYNLLKITDDEEKIIEISTDNHLSDFILDNSNKIGKTYKKIYEKFIQKQNDELEYLLDLKIDAGIFVSNCKNKINIQNIKEDEIFTFRIPKQFSFIDIIFNSSYRKIIDNKFKDFKIYNRFVIDYEFIENSLTELLLQNKKLLNEEVFEFIYGNEIFNYEITNLITTFKTKYLIKNIDIYDKVALYQFSLEDKENKILCKKLINDFITLLQYLNWLRKVENKNDFSEENKIYEVIEIIKDQLSNEFKRIFQNKNNFTIDKTSNIFDYYLKLVYEIIKDEIKDYQVELEEKSKKEIEQYYKEKRIISKKDFSYAIRLFLTLVLFREEDLINIKSNCNNIINYLKGKDLWDKNKYNDEKFNENLNNLKNFKVKVNQSLFLYEFLGKDIEDNFLDDVNEQIEREKELEKSKKIEPEIAQNQNESLSGEENEKEEDNWDYDDNKD